jgi:hypothetical protein
MEFNIQQRHVDIRNAQGETGVPGKELYSTLYPKETELIEKRKAAEAELKRLKSQAGIS